LRERAYVFLDPHRLVIGAVEDREAGHRRETPCMPLPLTRNSSQRNRQLLTIAARTCLKKSAPNIRGGHGGGADPPDRIEPDVRALEGPVDLMASSGRTSGHPVRNTIHAWRVITSIG